MKTISTAGDLAINGAPPAFESTLHVGSPHLGDRELLNSYIDDIYNRNWITNNGPLVQEFESRVAGHHGVEHCVAMANGTIALEIAIRALELDGEVIVPSYTFIATAHALHWQAITPVFADIDPVTHNISPAAVKRMITAKTSGIIGVHLWGRCAPVEELESICQEHDLKLMFDAAHAFGCSREGRSVGSFGQCEVLSFHATKFMNTVEGGAVLTNCGELAAKLRLMRNFGFSGLDNVIHPGTNGKMDEFSAAMGLVNLESIGDVVEVNRRNFQLYLEGISGIRGLSILPYDPCEKNNYQYIVVQVDDSCPLKRDDIVAALHAENVRARKYFWPGCHEMHPYCELYPNAGVQLPNTKDVSERVIVMPTGASVSPESISAISLILRVLLGDGA